MPQESYIDIICIIAQILCAIVFLTGTLGNALIVYIFGWKKRGNRKNFDRLLLILAVTDLFSSFIVPILFMYGTVTKFQQWHFGHAGCKILISLLPVTVTLSHGILIFISYDRYRAIHHPLRLPFKRSFICVWLIVTSFIAFILASPYIYSLRIIESFGGCLPAHALSNHIFALGSLLRDVVATIAMIILGAITTNAINKSSSVGSSPCMHRRKRSKRARKILTALVCVFSVCVIPADLFQVGYYSYITIKGDNNVHFDSKTLVIIRVANTLLQLLQVSNSAWNVVIYSWMQKDVHRVVVSCFRRLTCFNSRRTPLQEPVTLSM